MEICANCARKGTCALVSYYEAQGEHIVKCGKRKPITNADRIRAMSDEELATLISENIDCGVCENVFGLRPCNERCCQDFWLDWLKHEAT